MGAERSTTEIEYSWRPFTLDGTHLSFAEHVTARLEERRCSCWGPAVYKWEGSLKAGPHAGKLGLLVGETGDLRQRIKQYVAGTQDRGNRLWRETFLSLGAVRLYTLELHTFKVAGARGTTSVPHAEAIASNNMRLVLEQMLVMQAVADAGNSVWVVNGRQ
jgi:hypothetical protein